ncbi:MAG: Maf family protein [Firmicutes bacterium]|nr:Maf family protein [Bacillota bacterium]MCL2255654.1 Maf family protein [Bacillota bacterium]
MQKIILASASPRRFELLNGLGNLILEVIPSNIDESGFEALEPHVLAMTLAEKKAKAVQEKLENNDFPILGADTIVVTDGEVLGKPKNENEAREFFKKLCGKSHNVITGVSVVLKNNVETDFEKTIVAFKSYDETIIEPYLKSKKPFDKAGGYGIQDEELKDLIESIEGDINNVIGLPTLLVEKILKKITLEISRSNKRNEHD